MRVKMTFEGGRDLEAALMDIKASTAKGIVRRALKESLMPVLEAWQRYTTKLTGHLVESETVGTKLNRRQRGLARRLGKSQVEMYVGTSDPAGLANEFGNRHQRANPGLRPAWQAEGGQKLLDRLGPLIWEQIEKTRVRAARRAAARARRMGAR